MTDELNIATPEGAEESAPSFHESIGNMKYNVVLHFAEKGGQTEVTRYVRGDLHGRDHTCRILLQRHSRMAVINQITGGAYNVIIWEKERGTTGLLLQRFM